MVSNGSGKRKEAEMRWSMWPVSIVVHVALVTAALIVPLTADEDPPAPAPLRGPMLAAMKTVPVPPEVIPSTSPVRSTRSVPSVVAPDTILPSRDEPSQPTAPGPPDLPIGNGAVDISAFGSGVVTGPPPIPPPPPAPVPPPAPKILRVGQGVREPRRIAGGTPEYPAIARSARVQGTVILEAVINERGTIERVRVLKSEPLLDAAAIAAVQNWRYTPTLLNGTPVSVLMTITINFTLQD
jgi:protein TonB